MSAAFSSTAQAQLLRLRLRRACERAGGIKAVASRCDISFSTLARCTEDAVSGVPNEVVRAVANATDTSVAYLRGMAGPLQGDKLQKESADLRKERVALRRALSLVRRELARANAVIDHLLSPRRDLVPQSEVAKASCVRPQLVSDLIAGKRRESVLKARSAIESWLALRGECPSCTRALSHDDFLTLLSRHVQPVTRAPKGSRVPKEPTPQ